MNHPNAATAPPRPATGRLPRWALVVAPLVATVVANADVAVLLFADPQSWNGRLRLVLAATLPLSTIASVWTLWLLVRSRRDMLHRDRAEAEMRIALDENRRVLRRELAVRRELDHRVRNNLAGLIGLIALYEKSGRPATQLAHALRGKVLAMKEVHDIINRSGGAPVDLHALLDHIADAIIPGPHRSALHAHGPDVTLTIAEASATAMVLQELVTNSLKHGALAAPDGRVTVRWTAAPARHGTSLSLRWEEDPVPDSRADTPPNTGIGLPLIEGFVRSDLHGDVMFGRQGDEWTVDLRAALSCGPRPHAEHATPGQEVLA